MNHSHKKRKKSGFSWILILTWNFGGWQVDFDAIKTIIDCFICYKHNGNIISTSVSEAVEKIPTDEKDCVLLCTATAVTKIRQTYNG